MTLDPMLLAIPLFGLTMAAEILALRNRGDLKGYELIDSAGSLTQGVGYLLTNAFWRIPVLAFLAWLSEFAVVDVELSWVWLPVVMVADDLFFYWHHRFGHEVHLGWAAHHTHHSSQHYNLSTALRQSWTEQLYHPIFGVPLVLLGVPVEMLIVSWTLSLLYQYWLHTELIGKMGWFGKVFNTPSHHRVHHGANPEYLDRNYAGILIIWDRMFGTFEPEVAPVVYGTTTGFDRQQPFVVAFHQAGVMLRAALEARSGRGRVMAFLGPPGWSEDGGGTTAAEQRAAAENGSVGHA